MPKKPNRPCACCGKMLWPSKGNRPQVCFDCIRSGRRLPPDPRTSREWTGTHTWGRRAFIAGYCGWCSEDFVTVGRGLCPERYCSTRCARRAAKSRSGEKFIVPQSVRHAIYERDGWICQLCMEETEPDSDPLSDWFPSLDHIIPQSHMLIPDHSPANLRTAHRWCNVVRGAADSHPVFSPTA